MKRWRAGVLVLLAACATSRNVPQNGDAGADGVAIDGSATGGNAEGCAPPRLIAPASGARLARQEVEFRYEAAGDVWLQICADPSCETVVEGASESAMGSRARRLEGGTYYWRAMVSTRRCASMWSPIWQFVVPVQRR